MKMVVTDIRKLLDNFKPGFSFPFFALAPQLLFCLCFPNSLSICETGFYPAIRS
jgi:hypothetical protein